MESVLLKFTNCRVLMNHEIVKDDLWVRNGKIVNPEEIFYKEKSRAKIEYCMGNNIIAPGFIDIQINGAYGVDFSHNTKNIEEGLDVVARGILANGVTAFCPTLVTSDPDKYKQIIPKFKKRKGSEAGAEILGVHLEGPFINPEKRGAHSQEKIRDFDDGVKTLNDIYGRLDNVSIITLAPEKEGAMEVISHLSTTDVLVSLGHTAASFHVGLEAVDRGVSLITHLFNGMNPMHHREPGLVGLIGESKTRPVYYSLVADGVHVHPSVIKFVYKANPGGLVLVTDAVSAAGKPEGKHRIGDKYIEIRDDAAYLADTDVLCGSIAKMNECVKFFKESTGCTLAEALEAASSHPARALGIRKVKGTLNHGSDADFICIDDDMNILSTWIAGKCVYKSDDD